MVVLQLQLVPLLLLDTAASLSSSDSLVSSTNLMIDRDTLKQWITAESCPAVQQQQQQLQRAADQFWSMWAMCSGLAGLAWRAVSSLVCFLGFLQLLGPDHP